MEGCLSETPPDTERSWLGPQVQWPRASLPPTHPAAWTGRGSRWTKHSALSCLRILYELGLVGLGEWGSGCSEISWAETPRKDLGGLGQRRVNCFPTPTPAQTRAFTLHFGGRRCLKSLLV